MNSSYRIVMAVLASVGLAVGAWGADGAGKPQTLIFRQSAEPREKAFTFLMPKDWKVAGGVFRVNPMQAQGPGNSLLAKCDLAIARDDAGTVMLRLMPTWNYADFSSPAFANMAGMFRPGANYNGMLVKPMPQTQQFLDEVFRSAHPQSREAKVLERIALPELAAVYAKGYKAANDALAAIGMRPVRVEAGAMVVEYTEGTMRFKEAIFVVLSDNRGSAACWSNDSTVLMRAPAKEAEQWKPVLDIVLRSIKINLQWLAAELKGADQRSKIVMDTARELQRLDKEIWQNRQRTNERIQHDQYLTLTGQDDYVNPYTNQVETDTSDYKHRWVTAGGDVIYTDNANYNPNQDDQLWTREWQITPAKRN